ncbi:ribonuclease Z [Microvirga terricola]|uniref:Ribonuclease Z n=1 Tax=Microvirga terricola TaxID=2719797 RepID=A0ABX0VDP4_9HYPH|nr:MBL fold metallo-hydrolase [Microvirga terricola]NIX77591.1 ribonuclease Z [Microvirga terricola]
MSWLIQPRLVNSPFDDPGLYIDFRYGHRALLFDLGDLAPLSSRELMRISHVFVSHTHIDHFAGFDRLLRVCLHRPGPLHLIGPPGFIDRVDHKLQGFTWNLVNEHSIDFQLHVAEFDEPRLTRAAVFSARHVFRREGVAVADLPDGVVLAEDDFRIEAVALDHGIPCLAFGFRETTRVNVRSDALRELGLPSGQWLNEAKAMVRAGVEDAGIDIPEIGKVDFRTIKDRLFFVGPGQSLAYVTDTAISLQNERKILFLARNADHLFIEAVFAERDRALAEEAHHLTAHEAGRLAHEAHVARLTVFHHSARYLTEGDALRTEAMQAFQSA